MNLNKNFGKIKSIYYWSYWIQGSWLTLILKVLGAKIYVLL